MSDRLRSYRIKYDVHCRFQNFFGKEIVVKNCYTDVQAKYKLGVFCEKKYGTEFEFITFKSVEEECKNFDGDLFDTIFGDNKEDLKDLLNTFNKDKK